MESKIKILVLGIGQSNFLNQLYGGLKEISNDFIFSIDKFKHISEEDDNENYSIFDKKHNFEKIEVSRLNKIISILHFSKTSFFWKIFFFELSQTRKLKGIREKLVLYATHKYRYEKYIKPLNIDILHFHFCIPENLIYLHFVDSNTKVICSFWGSDLYRNHGASNSFYLEQALKKATKITVQTSEMELVLKAKYGHFFAEKIQNIRFTLHPEIYKNIDKFKNDDEMLNAFKNKYSIELNKKTILVGHNAFSENNHFKIIHELLKLPKHLLNDIVVILHLSYGGTNEYIKVLKEEIEKINDLKFILITDFLNPIETAKLRIISNIMIHMPISDALSGAMTELLYAGNTLITAGWLPYGILRRNGVQFLEIERFNQIPFTVEKILKNNDLVTNKNREQIRAFLFPDTTTSDWLKLLKTVYGN